MKVDEINKLTKSVLGPEYIGYIPFLAKGPVAGRDLELHASSAMEPLFCADPDEWNTHFRPIGASKTFILEDQSIEIGAWFDHKSRKQHLERFGRSGGYNEAVQWYRTMVGNLCLPNETDFETQIFLTACFACRSDERVFATEAISRGMAL